MYLHPHKDVSLGGNVSIPRTYKNSKADRQTTCVGVSCSSLRFGVEKEKCRSREFRGRQSRRPSPVCVVAVDVWVGGPTVRPTETIEFLNGRRCWTAAVPQQPRF